MSTSLLQDVLAFLEQPEHEMVNVYRDDYAKNEDGIYCGLALGWEQERDALIVRIKASLEPQRTDTPADRAFVQLLQGMGATIVDATPDGGEA